MAIDSAPTSVFDRSAPFQRQLKSRSITHQASKEGFGGLLVYDKQTNKTNGGLSDPLQPPSDNTQCDDAGREENSWTQQIIQQLQFL
ncbi:hypothetical protein OXX79_014262 [Metschnikowia pulcherrima]